MTKQLKTYRVVELDANDVSHTLRTGLTQGQAREKLAMLRGWAKEQGWTLRYIMVHDTEDKPYDPRCGDALWTGNIAGE